MVTKLRIVRAEQGITQHKLSHLSGIPERRICFWENGFNSLKPHEKAKIAEILGRAFEDIFPEGV